MAIYYDDILTAGTLYQPPDYGQSVTGFADDFIFVGAYVFFQAPIPPTPPTPDSDIITLGARHRRRRSVEQIEAEEAAEVLKLILDIRAGRITKETI